MGLAQLELRFVHGREEDALSSAERALEIDPGLAEAHCTKARYLEEDGRTDEAEKQIRTAQKLDPESWEVNREAGRMLFRHGHVCDAIPFFAKAAALNDTDWQNAGMLITSYLGTGDEARMLEAAQMVRERVQRAVNMDPTNGTALAMGAYALAMLGEKDRSREWMRRALLLDPENLAMRYNAACCLLRQIGDTDEALKTLESFFQKVTSTTWIWHAEADPDLEPIRDDARFRAMLAASKERLAMPADNTAAE
jgi:adenylate cyclase